MPRILQLLLACCILAVPACQPRGPAYVSEVAEIGDIRDVVPAVGRLKAEGETPVRPDVPGRVLVVLVDANAQVTAGQPLARLEVTSSRMDVAEANSEVEAARAALAMSMARARESSRVLANRRTLAERGLYSAAAVTSAEAQAEADAAAVRQAEASLATAGIRARRAGLTAAETIIRAPISGIVMARNAEVGQRVGPGDAEPMFVLADPLSAMQVEVEVAEPDIGRINDSLAVAFTVEAWPTETFPGRIHSVLQSPRVDRSFVAYPVLVSIENPDGRLRPGMTASVEFVGTDLRQVLRIPIRSLYFVPEGYVYDPPDDLMRDLGSKGLTEPAALNAAEMGVLFAGGKRRVFVEKNGRWERREVRIGGQSREHVEILEGVVAGERVIVEAANPSAQRA